MARRASGGEDSVARVVIGVCRFGTLEDVWWLTFQWLAMGFAFGRGEIVALWRCNDGHSLEVVGAIGWGIYGALSVFGFRTLYLFCSLLLIGIWLVVSFSLYGTPSPCSVWMFLQMPFCYCFLL